MTAPETTNFQAFVASERNGHWGTAIEVPSTRALNTGRDAQVSSVSCSQPGSCTADGFYMSGRPFSGYFQGFVVSQS